MQKSLKKFFLSGTYVLIFIVTVVFTFTGFLKNYVLVSFLTAAGILAVFFVSFEQRKPQPKDILPIAVLCTVASLGRLVFSFIPQIQPVTAIVIIAGVCFGRNVGFLTGSLCALISNLFLGQGPWTVWQMLAWGIIGFIAGFLKNAKMPVLFFYGFLSGFLYGYIVDIWTVSTIGEAVTPELFFTVYAAATFFNFLHAVGNVVFLALIFRPFSKKIYRIREKYGVMESF